MKIREKIKYAQLDLLDEVDRICRKNNIKYWITGGTLIGAIRHNGFIPWDDDIDIGMERKEYDKFIIACKSDLQEVYELIDWDNDEYNPLPFLKVKIRGTHYEEDISRNSKMNNGIFIDIFPYDNVPEKKLKQKIQKFNIKLYRKILFIKCDFDLTSNSIKKKILYFPIYALAIFFRKNNIKEKLRKEMIKYNDFPSKFIVNHGGTYSYEREMIKKEWIEFLVLHKFEKGEYYIPKRYDEFLKHIYGDYMKMPPIEERRGRHGVTKIDFGDYQIKYNK